MGRVRCPKWKDCNHASCNKTNTLLKNKLNHTNTFLLMQFRGGVNHLVPGASSNRCFPLPELIKGL